MLNTDDADSVAGSRNESAYSSLYKNSGRTTEVSQEQRRLQFLEEQREKRQNLIDEKRQISEWLIEEVTDNELIDTKKKKNRHVGFRIMMSEWFTDIPDDLAENWIVRFCPFGKRRLVITQKHYTKCYNKFGHLSFGFESFLPGGSQKSTNSMTVLDCIFQKETNTFFVLDVLLWNSVSFLDCDVSFRYYFIKSKFDEDPTLFEPYNKSNRCKFELLQSIQAEVSEIKNFISNLLKKDDCYDFDGLIFHHKEGLYIQGISPLVTWLKPYMLGEKLNMEVPPQFLTRVPKNYVNMEEFLNGKRKHKKLSQNDDEMESEATETDEIVDEMELTNN